jgi:hypothetical protein
MKIKQTIPILLTLIIFSTAAFSQTGEGEVTKYPVVIGESGITNITVSDNIDLLLINAGDDEVRTRIPSESLNKVRVFYAKGNLRVSTKGSLPRGERIPVYVYVNDLKTLTLLGNAFARSQDVLQVANLKVNIEDQGKIALKSTGKVKVSAPDDYRVVNEERYHLVLSRE